jgi:hypothetical protein
MRLYDLNVASGFCHCWSYGQIAPYPPRLCRAIQKPVAYMYAFREIQMTRNTTASLFQYSVDTGMQVGPLITFFRVFFENLSVQIR